MADNGLKQLLVDGIHAVQGAAKVGSEGADKMESHATNPELLADLRHGAETAEKWRQRLESAERAAGGHSSAPRDNDVMKSIQGIGEKIVRHAEDAQSRDLGIISTGQVALHYYIAAFGSLASYAKSLGLTDVASNLHQCLDEAKQADERQTQIAQKIIGAH